MVSLNKMIDTEAIEASARPRGLVEITDRLQQPIDRRLGYVGQGRFVFFRFVTHCDGAIWNDGRSSGFGYGAWTAFDDVLPAAKEFGYELGAQRGAMEHVLLVDRRTRQTYIADRASAEDLVVSQNRPQRELACA